MAIRLTIDGVHVECDTPQEVAALIRAAKPREKDVQPRTAIMKQEIHVSPFLRKELPEQKLGLQGNPLEFLIAMKEAFPGSVSSQQIASRLGKTLKSLPIILVGLQNYAKKHGARFDELVIRTNPPNGEKGSSYKLTDKGLKVFFRYA